MQSGFIWLRIKNSGYSCEHMFRFHDRRYQFCTIKLGKMRWVNAKQMYMCVKYDKCVWNNIEVKEEAEDKVSDVFTNYL